MSRRMTCPQGHAWETAADLCPVCGAAPQPERERTVVYSEPRDPSEPRCSTLSGAEAASAPRYSTLSAHRPEPPLAHFTSAESEAPAPDSERTVLVADRVAPTPLQEGAATVCAGPYQPTDPEIYQNSIPNYEILGVLGRGGMGVVYRARQVNLKRVVALKMILAGAHATPHQRARFRTEAEAVARLQHPGIVHIYEVGEHQGVPYFSLEYADGGSLADRLRGTPLPAASAAELVESLARAMHHAHQQGIVHRDLKPGNVLLKLLESQDNDCGPALLLRPGAFELKVTDFGLAKQMEGSDANTQSGAVVGTPSYMAPEQAAGDIRGIGPRTDVYALGAILYEMLTGRPPFHAAAFAETLQQVLYEEPVRPGRLQPGTPRDLETICLKCLQKEPGKRYATALELADDLKRFRNGEAIRARPVGSWERALKWARRRPAAAGLLFVSLAAAVMALAGWAHFTMRVSAERDAAEANLRLARSAVDEMLTEVAEEQLAREPRMQQKQRALLERALLYYENFRHKRDDVPARRETAEAHRRVGDIQRKLGRGEEARRAYESAISLLEPLTRANPGVPAHRHALATCYNWLGEMHRTAPRLPEALVAYGRAMALQQELAAAAPDHPEYRKDLARSHYNVGIVLKQTREPHKAAEEFRRAIEIIDDLHRKFPQTPAYRQELARCLYNRGPVLRALDDPAAGSDLARAVALLDGLVAEFPREPDYRYELLVACNNAGNHLAQTKGPPSGPARLVGLLAGSSGPEAAAALALPPIGERSVLAVALHCKAAALGERLHRDFPDVTDYRKGLANTYLSLGTRLLTLGDAARAEEILTQARDHQAALVEEFPGWVAHRGDLGWTLGNLGGLYRRRGDYPAAREHLTRGIDNVLRALEPNPKEPGYLDSLRYQYRELAEVLLHLKDHAAAAEAARARTKLVGATGRDHFYTAHCLARCARLAPTHAQSDSYAELAVMHLNYALDRGYVEMRGQLDADATFAPLRGRPDYDALMWKLGRPRR